MSKSRGYAWLVLTLFFCSGGTALIYEVVWSKYLSQMFGSTIQAQTVVLAVFMGGLALGNRLFGNRAGTLRGPLRTYGFVEVAIGLYAFFFPTIYQFADSLFVSLGSRVLDQRLVLLSLKGALSFGLLIVPTLLMGGTLPLLVTWLEQSAVEAGRRSARFYSVNSLGAVCGSGLAGFFLVQALGMVATLQAAALVNVVVGGAAILLGRAELANPAPPEGRTDASTGSSAETAFSSSPRLFRWAAALVAVTGGVSMGLEVLASRSLALIFGSSLQSFAIVLMSFILGIGLGSAVIASPRLRRGRSELVLVLLLAGAAVWVGLMVIKIDWWVEVYRYAKAGLARSTMGYRYYQVLAAAVSMCVLGLPAALIGSVLPLLIRALSGDASALGKKVGRLLTWNTLGAVGGVLTTGFLLMPTVGLRGSFGVLACCLGAIAVLAAWLQGRRALASGSGGILAALGLLFASSGDGWRHAISSGAFRARELEPTPDAMPYRRQHVRILFYEDAPDATVSVEQGDGIEAPADVGLRINGKTDASSRLDLGTQTLLGHLPLAARPESKDVFMLGLGGGVTGGAVLKHPIERLVIAENCEPVVRAARFFAPWNGGVLTDPRTRLWVEDARTILKLSSQRYDVIISQPSNPWMAGVGSVFSREYYELASTRLKEGGVMAQWFHLYDMHDGIVDSVFRTFGSVYPYMELWDSGAGDVLLLGSKRPWNSSVEHYQKTFDREQPRADLAKIGIHSPEALLARQFASQRTAFAITGDGPIQSDLFPILEYEAPRAFYLGISASSLNQFDERTWQEDIASASKRAALAGLDAGQLRQIFSFYSTINTNLQNYLVWRLRNEGTPAGAAEPLDLRALPCVFRPANASPLRSEAPASATDEIKKLMAAATLLQNTSPPDQRLDGVNQIESLLRQRTTKSDWSPAHYAALAARASLALGQAEKSRQLVELGLKSDPADLQLQYLARILEREQPGTPKLSASQYQAE